MAKPTFKANPIQVQVPATSANLGPGFDSFGLALGMHDRYVAQILDEVTLDIDVTGEGAEELPRSEKNLLVKAMYKGFDFLGGKPKGVAVRALNVIPHGRGLGSSASAIVGGLSLARALVLTGIDKMSDEKLLQLATQMEGHPDNVAAALHGGAVVAWMEDQHGKSVPQAISLSVDMRVRAIAFIPAKSVSTAKARKMLPESIPHREAVQNSTNSALLVHALTLRPDLLFRATEDFLHQSYRQDAMPASFALLNKLRAAGVAAFISGAGPTVLVLHTGNESEAAELARAAGDKFEAKAIEISPTGVVIL
ncbi:MAG: homoserine kinase [Candidatus Planktophila sp.]|jgi:homoserine kinase|tara:strand:+ start:3931 stop:4857 length:927 start_codon:yes stop_codon:yes gene_type:complete